MGLWWHGETLIRFSTEEPNSTALNQHPLVPADALASTHMPR